MDDFVPLEQGAEERLQSLVSDGVAQFKPVCEAAETSSLIETHFPAR